MATLSTLMPPVVETFQPAFLNNGNMKVYFSPSSFNTFDLGWKLHVTIRRQSNNENVIDTTKHPNGIIVYNYSTVNYNYDYDKNMYYVLVELSNTIFYDETQIIQSWPINEYYKVQLRFDNATENYDSTWEIYQKINYINSYLDYFSEWSSITLIKPISQPSIYVNPFSSLGSEILNWGTVHVTGNLQFALAGETERLQSYIIQILNNDEKIVLFDSGDLFPTDNPADIKHFFEINYLLNLQNIIDEHIAQLGGEYVFKIIYNTNSGYTNNFTSKFKVQFVQNDKFAKTNFSVNINNELGCVNLDITNDRELAGMLYLRRTSSLSKYKTWELLGSYLIEGEIDIQFDDYTVQNLTWYKYTIQFESLNKEMSQIIYAPYFPQGGLVTDNAFFIDFDNAFVYQQDKQLSVLPDLKVSNYKINITRTKSDTLGGKYPVFAENGNLHYRQLSISGKITSEFDVYRTFLEERNYLGYKVYQDYLEYKDDKSILDIVRNDYLNTPEVSTEDILWERIFRDKVEEWMNDGTPKLLRTQTEGNILVLFSDFSMTPVANLSRVLYDFNVTAYEIGNGNLLSDLQSNKVIPFNNDDFANLDPEIPIYIQEIYPGQEIIQSMRKKTGDSFYSLNETVKNRLGKQLSGILDGNKAKHICFTKVKLIFTAQFAEESNIHLKIYPDTENGNYDTSTAININLKDKVLHEISDAGIDYSVYQLPSNMYIDDIQISSEIEGYIEYVLSYKRVLGDLSETETTSIVATVVGQISGTYQYETSIAPLINKKYYYACKTDTAKIEQKVESWRGIRVYGPVMSVIKCTYKTPIPAPDNINAETQSISYLIGYDGVLTLMPRSIVYTCDGTKYVIPENYDLTDLQFIGSKFIQTTSINPREWEFILDTQETHVERHVYKKNNQYYIYYSNQEWLFDYDEEKQIGIAHIPVQSTIDYLADILRKESHNV